jgi:hypothetical protein
VVPEPSVRASPARREAAIRENPDACARAPVHLRANLRKGATMRLRILRRVERSRTRRRARRLEAAAGARTATERELLEGRLGDWKEDVFAAGGDGATVPTLPEAGTAEELYEEFERDEERPPDLAP